VTGVTPEPHVAQTSAVMAATQLVSANEKGWCEHLRYAPLLPQDRLDQPSLAIMLPNGLIAATDEWHHRVVLIDPLRQAIVWQ
jgi:hypothetical protein